MLTQERLKDTKIYTQMDTCISRHMRTQTHTSEHTKHVPNVLVMELEATESHNLFTPIFKLTRHTPLITNTHASAWTKQGVEYHKTLTHQLKHRHACIQKQ